jgi:glycosyltransferase involved in cell wall biosynthesis
LHRKGIDILLDAYVRAFSAYDDVVLVIKDMGTQTVYRGQNERERILGLVADSTRPRIVYLEHDLSAHELAGIYTAADCLVQPYRGEGFCLPALEAMACGIPVLVPAGGPTDDFVDETVGWRLAAERKPFGDGQIGPMPCVGPTWMLEVSPQELARKMREAYGKREEVARRGKAARQRVETGWTWRHAGEAAMRRLEALRAKPQRAQSLARLSKSTARPVSAPGGKPALIVVDSTRTKGKGVTQDANSVHRANGSLMPMRNRPTISLCMIVKNEERVLGDCLASILPYVEEVIVVDTGSTDRTVEIAEAAGPKVKVFHFPWGNDFSEARNVSLSHATMDWVLWMDADDTILPECGAKLHELAMLAEDRVTGFILQVHIPPAPGEHGFTVVDHVKLFRNGLNLRFEGRIHEQILEPIYRMGGTIERSDLYVVHSGYDYSPEGQKRKRERDLTILDLELAERPDFAFLHYNRGMTFHHLKQHEQAISALERYLELTEGHESTTRKVYALLAGSHLELRQLERAKERLEQGLRLFPQDPELNFRGGILYREVGNVAAAERCYLVAIRSREVGHLDSLDVSMTGYKAYHNLGLLYRDSGRLAEAEASWRAAVGENAAFVPSWLGLGQLFVQTRRFEDARGVAEKLATLDAALAEGLRQDIARMAGESR